MNIFRTLLLAGLAVTLTACGTTPLKLDKAVKEMGERPTMIGYVANIRDTKEKSTQMEELCADWLSTPFEKGNSISRESYAYNQAKCRNLTQYNFVWMHLYGQYGNFVGAWVLVPKTDAVKVDDIAKIDTDNLTRQWNVWRGVVVKAEDKAAKGCDWVGNKILNLGGVVCPSEGWDYRNLPAFKKG